MPRARAFLAIAALLLAIPAARAAPGSTCLREAVNASGLAGDEPLASYKARANWDAEVRMRLGGDYAMWGAAEAASVTCGAAKRGGGHFCVANARPCRFAGR